MSKESLTLDNPADVKVVEHVPSLLPLIATTPAEAEAFMKMDAKIDEIRGKHLVELLKTFQDHGMFVPEKGVDLSIRGKNLYYSENLWIRNARDGGTVHQEPKAGQDNWFYARVTNHGTRMAPAFVVLFNVKKTGFPFPYPKDYIPFISAAVGFGLAPHASMIVMAKWPKALVPAAGTHPCCIAAVLTRGDVPPKGSDIHTSENLAQHNVVVVNAVPGETVTIPFQLRAVESAEVFRLEAIRSKKWEKVPVAVVHRNPRIVEGIFHTTKESKLDATGVPVDFLRREGEVKVDAKAGFHLAYHHGTLAGFPMTLPTRAPVELGLKITVPQDAKPGEVIDVHLIQKNRENEILGGIAAQVHVVAKH